MYRCYLSNTIKSHSPTWFIFPVMCVDITTSVASLPKSRVSGWHTSSKRCPRTSELLRMKRMDRWRMVKVLCLLSTWCSSRAWAPTPPPSTSPSQPSSRSSPATPQAGLYSFVSYDSPVSLQQGINKWKQENVSGGNHCGSHRMEKDLKNETLKRSLNLNIMKLALNVLTVHHYTAFSIHQPNSFVNETVKVWFEFRFLFMYF